MDDVQKLSLTSRRDDLIALTSPIVLNDFLTFLCTMKTQSHSLLIHNDKVFVAESGLLFSCRWKSALEPPKLLQSISDERLLRVTTVLHSWLLYNWVLMVLTQLL